MKRQLNNDEKEIILKQLSRLREEQNWNNFNQKHAELFIEEGLYQNYLKQLQEYKLRLIKLKQEIQQNNQTIETLETQLKEGVEKKVNKNG